MNRKMIFYMLGRIVQLEAVLMLIPLSCSLYYREDSYIAFLITIGIAAVLGLLLMILSKTEDKTIFAKEGFVIVALAWIVMSALGALPFYISGAIKSYIDAFFETVSGITTTGASILTDIEAMPKGLLFWRSFTHWIGGMGVLVLVMAILPTDSGSSIHIMRAEMPGPVVGKLVPRLSRTAKILYLIYIFFTVTQVLLLLCGGMSLFESLIYSFGTAGTGGFGVRADSAASYTPFVQWVITIFMLIFGANFNYYYLILARKGKTVLKSEELWTYLAITVTSIAVVTANISGTAEKFKHFSDSLRYAAFQVSSILTTTGFATDDFNLWPGLSRTVLFLLMFIGGCAGSTAGGFKVSRIVILFKNAKANIKHILHPRSVESVRFEGKPADRSVVTNVTNYLAVYVICFVAIFFILSFEKFDLETNITAVAACFNNVGPGLGAVGPAGNYFGYSVVSKLALAAAMLFGRLEILPMLILFSPQAFAKKRKNAKS